MEQHRKGADRIMAPQNIGTPQSVNIRDGSVIVLQQNQPDTVWRYRSGGKTALGNISVRTESIVASGGGKVEIEWWKNGARGGGMALVQGAISVPGVVILDDGDLLEVKLIAKDGVPEVFDMWLMYRVLGG